MRLQRNISLFRNGGSLVHGIHRINVELGAPVEKATTGLVEKAVSVHAL
jgi:hypothetical protein